LLIRADADKHGTKSMKSVICRQSRRSTMLDHAGKRRRAGRARRDDRFFN
jgi:hypothetical protein